MKINEKQFDLKLKQNQLVLSLVGMSNIGKSFCSKQLQNIGFKRICCDDLIEKKLAKELKKFDYKDIRDVSKWMGQPYDERFEKNQRRYLEVEAEVMNEILDNLAETQNVVIDTTGSVVHTGDKICTRLKEASVIIYLATNKEMEKFLFENYIKKPKPVIWENMFVSLKNESDLASLKRCYPKLLDYRKKLYTKYADVIIPRAELGRDFSVERLIFLIKKYL